MILHGLMPQDVLPPALNQAIRLVLVGGFLLLVSRPIIDLRANAPLQSILLGVVVFVVWIGPDLVFPGYREAAPFNNGIVGRPESSFPEAARGDVLAVSLRAIRVVLLIPIVEELFWRGWLPRWANNPDFQKVPLGTFTPVIFVVTAVLFASEHGSWWDVGLLAGIAYNWWIIRTRSLGDCILAHAVTNGCLAVYVVAQGRWEYW
jgi:CAAX prenyl protease-like protein